ncbi:MAG TPA: prephenate dehydratase domain-containing protein, partial [Candidatus Limnocylindrales bacterium]|nr:prephenate dehydratase domain-containing protein [Candidatus Limnocylindrales bacterium]
VLRWFQAPSAKPVRSFRAVFEAVRDGGAAAGVVPLESSLLGTIRETLDLLYEFELEIAGEVSVPVRLALLGLPGARLETIRTVHSIAAALAQADVFLRSRSWTVETTWNTAGAARAIADAGDASAAAVASPRAAALYGLKVVADGIQTGTDNRTRFAVIGRADAGPMIRAASAPTAVAGSPKTTLVFGVGNVPGSLYRSLGAFASRGINLSRLESRPWTGRGSRWEYVFWADLDADAGDGACAAALADLRGEAEMVRVIGTYPRAIGD